MTPTATTPKQPDSSVRTPIQVKKLGHVVLRVNDVERSTKFWTEIMGFRISDRNEQGMVFLHHGSDHHTIALGPTTENRGLPTRDQVGFDHMAFEVGSFEQLFEIRAFLREKGVPIYFEGRRGPGSNPGVEFMDPDGFKIEVYASMDQLPPNGKWRPAEQWRRARSLEEVVANPLPPYPAEEAP